MNIHSHHPVKSQRLVVTNFSDESSRYKNKRFKALKQPSTVEKLVRLGFALPSQRLSKEMQYKNMKDQLGWGFTSTEYESIIQLICEYLAY